MADDDKGIIQHKKSKRKKKKRIDDPVLRELDAIKRLLLLDLVKKGTTQAEISTALGIDQGDLSRIMPTRKFKPYT